MARMGKFSLQWESVTGRASKTQGLGSRNGKFFWGKEGRKKEKTWGRPPLYTLKKKNIRVGGEEN